MTDFKDYSDKQLISQFKLLADEIAQRDLILEVANDVEKGSFLDHLSTMVIFHQTAYSESYTPEEFTEKIMDKFEASTNYLKKITDDD